MKKRLIIGGLILSSGLALASSTYADANTVTTQNRKSPPSFSQLSQMDRTTLESLTGSARDTFLESKGITRPTDGSGWLDHRPERWILGNLTLTDAEKTKLESMTESERQAFFESKWLTRPIDTGTGKVEGRKINTLTSRSTRLADQEKQESTLSNAMTTQSRTERIKANAAKVLEQKKVKLQKKITAGETLTRLEKKFADNNDIAY